MTESQGMENAAIDTASEEAAAACSTEAPKKHGRRRLLAGLGTTGLLASINLFGNAEKAFAANYGCCNLANYPPNTTWSYCQAHSVYTWYCQNFSGSVTCGCCETSGYALSGGTCYHN